MASPSLNRVVRFHVSPKPLNTLETCNTYAGQPMCNGLSAYYEIEVSCHAPRNSLTGFVESIYVIDKAVRTHVVPMLSDAFLAAPSIQPHDLLPSIFERVDDKITSILTRLSWRLSPYYEVSMNRTDTHHVCVKRRYTFSAAHRLHNAELDDQENKELYGKCAWPSGHGHNYTLETSIAIPVGHNSEAMTVVEMDALVHTHVIDLFDHRNLDLDIDAFKSMNSTLENITVECHRLLAPAFNEERGRLAKVRVWETDRTSCEYPPPASSSMLTP
jgi:6-pyruvoyltetrahydropterin/6-carboxytetrahydropterin synthase